jgi:hypothetical protein
MVVFEWLVGNILFSVEVVFKYGVGGYVEAMGGTSLYCSW